MKKTILYTGALIASILMTFNAYTQDINGYLMSRSDLWLMEMTSISENSNGFSTARSSAMGNAFTALGADMSALSYNPAGLGLYRSSEFSITPAVSISKFDNGSQGIKNFGDNSRTRFGLNSLGFAFNLHQGTGALTSLTFAVGYNKLQDFNYRSSVNLSSKYSIAEVFANQLYGVNPNALLDDARPSPWQNQELFLNEWGAILGYKTVLLEDFRRDDIDMYSIEAFGRDTDKNHYLYTNSKGSMGDFSFALGFNFQNIFYFGLGLDLQRIYIKQDVYYDELYTGDNSSEDPLTSMSYRQTSKIWGTSPKLKFGILVNPVEGLRIGMAVHTPTFVSIKKDYSAGMSTLFTNGLPSTRQVTRSTDIARLESRFNTPTRLMTGVSYTFGAKGIISVDYEHAWYDGMRVFFDDDERYYNTEEGLQDNEADFRRNVKKDYKGRDIFRVGAEYKPVPMLALRAGYVYTGSFLKDEKAVFNSPVAHKGYSVTAGTGFRLSPEVSLDIAYAFINTKYTAYDMFFYEGPNNDDIHVTIPYQDPNTKELDIPGIRSKQNRHNIMFTLGVRF